MKSVEAVDDATVRITLNRPQPDFLIPLGSRYTTIHPKDLVDSGEIDKKVIGTGPRSSRKRPPARALPS
jgi:ABC-type transport system substrate-binding protein